MLKTTYQIKCLSPEIQNEICKLVEKPTLVFVLDHEGNITPLAIGDGETTYIDESTAKEKVLGSKYTSLSNSLTFSFGEGSRWCLVRDGGNFLYNYHP